MKLKIYLDTSVIAARFDDRNPDRRMLTEDFWTRIPQYEVYVSDLTLDEIEKNKNPILIEKMQLCAKSFTVLKKSEEVMALMKELMYYNAVPQNSSEDAYHLAVAVVAGMDYLLSWNFRHLVRLKTREIMRMVTTLRGYSPIEIIAPPQLI
jgi:predicted nucleic acid-binding protein